MHFGDGTSVGPTGISIPVTAVEAAPFNERVDGTSSVDKFDGQYPSDGPTPIPIQVAGLPMSIPVDTLDNPDIEPAMEAAYKKQPLTAKMRRLTDLAIVTELVIGSPVEVIAKNHKVDVLYVQRVRGEWLKACKIQESFDYRHEFKVLALEAVREGLKTKTDPFKRMQGGIRTLQGIGEFKPDTVNVAVLQRIENVPVELRGRYLTSSPEDEQYIPAEIVHSETKEG